MPVGHRAPRARGRRARSSPAGSRARGARPPGRPPARRSPCRPPSTGTARPPCARRARATTGERVRSTTTRSRPPCVRTRKDSPPSDQAAGVGERAPRPPAARGSIADRRRRAGARPARDVVAVAVSRLVPRVADVEPVDLARARRRRLSPRREPARGRGRAGPSARGRGARSSPRLAVSKTGGAVDEAPQELASPRTRERVSRRKRRPLARGHALERLEARRPRARRVRLPTKPGLVTPCRFTLRWPVRYSTLVAAFAIADARRQASRGSRPPSGPRAATSRRAISA